MFSTILLTMLKRTEMPTIKHTKPKDGEIYVKDKLERRHKNKCLKCPKMGKMVYIPEDRILVDSKGRTEAETISDYFEKRKITKLTK